MWQAAERMHQRVVGTLVVVDADKRPVGIITDRDLVERVLAKALDPNSSTVGEIKTRVPETVSEQTPIEQVIDFMRRERCRRLPVKGYHGQLVVLLRLDDVLQLWAEELTSSGLLEQQNVRSIAQTS